MFSASEIRPLHNGPSQLLKWHKCWTLPCDVVLRV